MKNLSSWLIVFFMIMYWGFRVVVAFMASLEMDFFIQPYDVNIEVALLFVVLLCVPFIFKRRLWAGIVYLVSYGWYLGVPIFTGIISMINGEQLSVDTYMQMFMAFIGVVIAIFAIFDILFDKSRKANPVDKKTDWFYKNKDFDRKLDERADKNNYRTY